MDRPTEVPAVPEAPNPTITGHVRVPLSLIAARVACGLPPPLLLPGVGIGALTLHEFALVRVSPWPTAAATPLTALTRPHLRTHARTHVALQAIPKASLDNIKAEMDAEKVARDAVYKVVPRDCGHSRIHTCTDLTLSQRWP
jgi:hypothetical protein